MQRLIYASRRVDDTDTTGFSATFKNIGDVSLRKNTERGITGFLICTRCWFAQILEGDPALIEPLLATIEKDPRHFNLLVLSRETCDDVVFPDWGMGWQYQTIANRIVFLEHQLVRDEPPRMGQAQQVLSVAKLLAADQGQCNRLV
jgi:hypothetical protein